MNILIVHNYYKIPGGEDVVVKNESGLLKEAGHKVILYTRHNEELDDMPFYKKLLLPFSFIYSKKTYRDIEGIIQREAIDIVMVHNTLMLISPSVYYAALKAKIPVIQVVHNYRLICPGATLYRDGHICEDCIQQGLGCAIRHACYRNSRFFTLACVLSARYHRFRKVYEKLFYICLTDFSKNKLLTFSQIKRERVFVKPNFTNYAGPVIPYEERDYFIYAGRLDDLKGIPELLEAWRYMGDDAPKLYICGDGPLKEWCEEYIEKHHVSSIVFKGKMEHAKVIGLIGGAKALILLSKWYEGLPMTIIEAFSVGTPVIGSDFGNIAAIVDTEQLGRRVDISKGSEAISEAVNAFLKGENRFVYDETAFQKARIRYGKEKNLEMLENILETVKENG